MPAVWPSASARGAVTWCDYVINRRQLLLAGSAAFLGACQKSRAFPGYAFVANQEGRAIAVVDLGLFTVVRHIRLDGEPTAVLSHPRRDSVYVLTPENGMIHEINSADLTLRRKLSLSRQALSMRLSPDGKMLWVATIGSPHLAGISVESLRVETWIRLPVPPTDFDVAASPLGARAAVSFGGTGEVGIVDLEAHRLVHRVSAGSAVGAVRFRSDGRHALAANPGDRRLSIIDAGTGATVAQLILAVRPDHLCFTADGGQLFITGEGMDAVVVVYPYRTEVAQTRLAGHSPGAMAASRNPGYLFVANPAAGDVTIIEIDTQRVIAVAAVGADPAYITITPDGQYALVLNRASGDMAVIRLGAIKIDRRRSAPLLTMIPVGSRPVSAAVRML